MKRDAKPFLGNGLHFPLRMNARGEIMLVTGSEDIEQSIHIILGTRPGERVMRPTFGCRAFELLFEPRSAGTASLLQDYVLEALQMWEPRIDIRSVVVTNGPDGGSLITDIMYEIKATHDVRSIVYPFFIEAEPEII